jgi:hypothetical protein
MRNLHGVAACDYLNGLLTQVKLFIFYLRFKQYFHFLHTKDKLSITIKNANLLRYE